MKKDKILFYELIDRETLAEAIKGKETPCYLFFSSIIKRQIERIRACTKNRFHIHYALKANPNHELLSELFSLGVGGDVASGGELKAAMKAGIPGEQIEFSGPGKRLWELELAIESGVSSINIENLKEIELINEICERKNTKANVGLRVNPEMPKGRAGMKMVGDTQFGMTMADARTAIPQLEKLKERLCFTGFHAHLASQELSAETLASNFRTVINFSLELLEGSSLTLKKLNFGGGWGIPYFSNQESLDLDILSKELDAVFDSEEAKKLPKDIRLIVEPGRFIAGECGVFATKVLYKKQAATKQFLITDGGMNANYVLAGGMGQVIKRNFKMDILPQSAVQKVEPYKIDVAGPLCTPQDVIANSFETDVTTNIDDVVVFFNCGAYGAAASPINFLGHEPPKEYFIRD